MFHICLQPEPRIPPFQHNIFWTLKQQKFSATGESQTSLIPILCPYKCIKFHFIFVNFPHFYKTLQNFKINYS